MRNLLFTLADLKLFQPVENLGDMLFKTLFGLLFVIVGIAVLVGIFTLLGLVMKKLGARSGKSEVHEVSHTEPTAMEEGLTPELVAVITAAVAASLEGEKKPCAFVVKRIKRL